MAKLAAWLRRLAYQEEGTAAVLSRLEKGDPSECLTRMRLFREIADQLDIVAQQSSPRRAPDEGPPR